MKRKLQKGFTLVELIVVMVLMGALMTAVVMILRPSQNTFKNVTNKAYEEQIALNISKLLNGSLRYATGVKVVCNDGTTPTSADFGKFKNYIKLSNNYRSSSVKGARGDFERGRIEGDKLKRVSSAIVSESFDEYDFQFFIASFNSKSEEASLTIGLRAMPMTLSTPDEEAELTKIKKPNPGFVTYWQKYYDYSETFEFINIRHKDTIHRVTGGVSVDPYTRGAEVPNIGNGKGNDGYVDPAKGDNTIWIFYTNPQEADVVSGGGGSSTASAGSKSDSSSTIAEPPPVSTPEYSTGTESGGTSTYSGTDTKPDEPTDTKPDESSKPDEPTDSPADSPADSSSNTDPSLGTATITIYGVTNKGSFENYNINAYSGAKYSSSVVSGDGYKFIPVTSSCEISISFDTKNKSGTVQFGYAGGGSVTINYSDVVGQNVSYWFYNGEKCTDETEAKNKKQKDDDDAAAAAAAAEAAESAAEAAKRTVTIHFSSSKKGSYQYGELDAGFVIDNSNANAQTSGSFVLNPGESKTVMLKSTWSSIKATTTISYDMADGGVTDVWIMNGSISTSKPSDWAD